MLVPATYMHMLTASRVLWGTSRMPTALVRPVSLTHSVCSFLGMLSRCMVRRDTGRTVSHWQPCCNRHVPAGATSMVTVGVRQAGGGCSSGQVGICMAMMQPSWHPWACCLAAARLHATAGVAAPYPAALQHVLMLQLVQRRW
jgi:hypothetical protein